MKTVSFFEDTHARACAKRQAILPVIGHRTTATLACGSIVVGIVDAVHEPRAITPAEQVNLPEIYEDFGYVVDVAMMCGPLH